MPLLDLDAIKDRTTAVRDLADTIPATPAIEQTTDDIVDLITENEKLRDLLSKAKPFLTHNGLVARLTGLGVTADPEYVQIAADVRTVENAEVEALVTTLIEGTVYGLGVNEDGEDVGIGGVEDAARKIAAQVTLRR